MVRSMNEVTNILSAIEAGDPEAAADLLPLVYEELRTLAAARMAAEKPGQTVQPTALVHEAYLRLVGDGEPRGWNSRGHFFAAAAEAMRRILVETARRKKALRRGGDRQRLDLDLAEPAVPKPSDDLLALDEALKRLAETDHQKAELIKLRYFAGLTMEQTAETLGISLATASRRSIAFPRHSKFARNRPVHHDVRVRRCLRRVGRAEPVAAALTHFRREPRSVR
jgi:RNA polymerase sigma factor (TIGR02999 family)